MNCLFSISFSALILSMLPTFGQSSCLSHSDLRKIPFFESDHQTSFVGGHTDLHWVCADPVISRVRVICDDLGINELEGPMGELQIRIDGEFYIHSYGLRHGIHMMECARMRRIMRRLLRTSREICIFGAAAGKPEQAEGEKNKIEVGWVFYELKSGNRRICEYDDCELADYLLAPKKK